MQNFGEQLLSYYWLRPETVLWRLRDIEVLQHIDMPGNTLDLCCGDGIYSFIRSGGELDLAYDAFVDVKDTSGFFNGVDIYADAMDSWSSKFVTKDVNSKINVGYDWKQGLLDKANRLNLYDKLVQGDANKRLCFADQEFDTIFSNAIYWMSNIEGLLSEMNRVLNDSGKVIVSVPDHGFVNASILGKRKLGQGKVPEYVKLLDRGRFDDNYSVVRSSEEWKGLFNKSGFKVVEHIPYLSQETISLWDFGLRPFSPFLIRMQHALKQDDLLNIKRDWVNEISPMIFEYFQEEKSREVSSGTGFNLFVLNKK